MLDIVEILFHLVYVDFRHYYYLLTVVNNTLHFITARIVRNIIDFYVVDIRFSDLILKLKYNLCMSESKRFDFPAFFSW